MSDTSDKQLLREVEDQSAWGPEEKRLRTIRTRRQTQGECILCGKRLGFFDKRSNRTKHKNCTLFVE